MTPTSKIVASVLFSSIALFSTARPLSFPPADPPPVAVQTTPVTDVRYGFEKVDGIDIFHRESGNPSNAASKPALVLLHGFPASSHMYRRVLAELGADYHVIAPDYPGFGNSGFPARDAYSYDFDTIAATMNRFLEQKNIDRYVLMIQDYGAPIGMRIATKHPERVAGIISMNGNVYEEGLSAEGWGPVMLYWDDKSEALEKTITENVFTFEAMRWQYTHGTRNPDAILPDNWRLDYQNISRPGQHRVQLDLFYDYQNNVKLYPEWQQYLRDTQPPLLAVWGKNDAFFPPAGAESFKRDVANAEVHLLDTGHFPLEEESEFIITKMRGFLESLNTQ